ncbi:hypothetical protein F0A16_15120 [Salinicola corii]|uniref:Uncharacterized protein n=1 Tax=Salinicola corii TaxID=2606937 RepID=A0A640WBH5_9GAMM|nr:hypothetical protein [Salinicola corii]KAA0016829.1 hypothetical protein F0A16_15120 [Salinicola corii]
MTSSLRLGFDLPPSLRLKTLEAGVECCDGYQQVPYVQIVRPRCLVDISIWSKSPAFIDRDSIRGVTQHIGSNLVEHWPVSMSVKAWQR